MNAYRILNQLNALSLNDTVESTQYHVTRAPWLVAKPDLNLPLTMSDLVLCVIQSILTLKPKRAFFVVNQGLELKLSSFGCSFRLRRRSLLGRSFRRCSFFRRGFLSPLFGGAFGGAIAAFLAGAFFAAEFFVVALLDFFASAMMDLQVPVENDNQLHYNLLREPI